MFLITITSNLLAMACNLIEMASTLVAMAFNLSRYQGFAYQDVLGSYKLLGKPSGFGVLCHV